MANRASSEDPRPSKSSLCAKRRAQLAVVVKGSAFFTTSSGPAAPGAQPSQNASALTSSEHSPSATKHAGFRFANVAFV